jgi:hypothetical protein
VATEQDYVALGKAREAAGKLLELGEDKLLKVKVEYPTLELKDASEMKSVQAANKKQAKQQQKLQNQLIKEYNQILKAKTPEQQLQRLQQFQLRVQALQAADAQQQLNAALDPRNNPFKTVTSSVEFQLRVADDVRVARLTLPIEYDDKGNVVEYTPEQLKKKRDPKMAGYTAKFEDLQAGQLVRFSVRRVKPADKSKDKEKDEAKEDAKEKIKDEVKDEAKDKGKDDPGKAKEDVKEKAAPAPPEHPQIQMILIVTDADPAAAPKEKRSKNKKANP